MSIRTMFYGAITCVLMALFSPLALAEPLILGVGALPISGPLQQHLGSPGRGVLVDRVVSGSTADQAGIVSGDVLASVEGQPILTPQQLSVVLRTLAGQTVEIELVRAQQPLTLAVPLGRASGSSDAASPAHPPLPHVNPSVVPDGFPPEIRARIEEMQRRMQRNFDQPLTPGATVQVERFGVQCETDAQGTRCEDLDGNPIDPSQGLPPASAGQAPDPLTERLRSLRDTLLDDDEDEEAEEDESNTPEGGLGGPPA